MFSGFSSSFTINKPQSTFYIVTRIFYKGLIYNGSALYSLLFNCGGMVLKSIILIALF